jgi:TnpA family transposase
MQDSLQGLDANIPKDSNVNIIYKNGKSRISISPITPLEDPPNINALKSALTQRWPATSLLDVLKEADLRTNFTKCFASTATRTTFDQTELSKKLLLALYGIGTNAGLKSMAAGNNNEVNYKELLHIRKRYIHRDNLRQATRLVTNATFRARLPEIWGTGTTSCASDSTQFSAWDQNLMTEWHQRYGGRGVMIYWHVDSKAACIHSQLKRCSSSEVASMMEGVLHHCTEMEVESQYVDTHGQSIIAFAFCYLLGFDLMPRFKGIDKQKLVRPDQRFKGDFPNIDNIFAKSSINWSLIAQQYDEMIKLATALLERTSDAEAILRRFVRGQNQHPVYAALLELGKAAKTLFLCRYLSSKTLRREINTGLNVVERWNGVNNFIYFGKGGEFATNRLEEQEVSVLSLHLLQASMVYVNTLMIQNILAEPLWKARMTERDMAALSPLPHSHFNPYGKFDLDMSTHLPLEEMRIAA